MSSAEADRGGGWWSCPPRGPGYPVLLAELDRPPSLRVRGTLRGREPMIAVVGARRMTAYGEDIARQLAAGLASAGVTVVSGLARGIDAAAHRGALEVGGRTVAVMGTGPDRIYPAEHGGLAAAIAASGALVTQFPAGTVPHRGNFPKRNAVISGLSLGVVVVEARSKSGAMLTAGAAGDQGRIVMAVPGSIHNPASRGCHDLLRDGAVLVTSAAEVLDAVRPGLKAQMVLPVADGAPVEADRAECYGDERDAVLVALEAGGLTAEEVVEAVSAPAPDVLAALARLRLDGLIRLREGVYGIAVKRREGE